MAFFNKLGNILRQTASKQIINSEFSALNSKPGILQAIRCFSSMPSSKLFIGGIAYSTDEPQLREAFSKYGQVVDARIIHDRETGRSRGFGFVTYSSSEEASCAIQALDGQNLHGRNIRVTYATDRAPRSPGGGGYDAPGGGYGRSFGGPGGHFGDNVAYGGNSASANPYGSEGNYGSNLGGNNYGPPGGSAGGDGSNANYGTGGNLFNGVAGGGGGSDNYGSGGGFGRDVGDVAGDCDQNAMEGKYQDDDDDDDLVKRA